MGFVLALGSQRPWEDRSRLLTSDIANFVKAFEVVDLGK